MEMTMHAVCVWNDADIDDLLVCGSCQRNFPLGNIVNFVQHKKFDCADMTIAGLMCQSCPQQFGTPWSLMKHAQSVHALQIYLETGPFFSSTAEVSYYQDRQTVPLQESNAVSSFSAVDNSKCNKRMLSKSPQQSADLNGAVTFMLNDSRSGDLQKLQACNVDTDQLNNSELALSSVHSDLLEQLENVPPKEYTAQTKSTSSDKSQHISGDLNLQAASTDTCLEDADTVSGHSAVLEKCCSSVLPKKRKRHMEIKHGSTRKRAPVVSSGPTSIYIDLEPGAEDHSFQASVSHDGLHKPSTVPELESSQMLRPSLRRRSVIIQPGMTFSIPVTCVTVSLAPSYNNPIVANSVTARTDSTSSYDQKLTAEQHLQTSNIRGSKPTAADAMTYDPEQEPTGTADEQNISKDEDFHDGEEHGQGKTLEHKRRRYPTSRPFKCDQCDNAFNQRIHLKKHQSKHTGVKPFKCDQCDYSTVERSHLKVHIRVHTGEKPYKCTYCEYATAQNSTLKIHLRRHHHGPLGTESGQAEAGYVCSKCGLQFEQQDLYQCHDAEQHTVTSSMQSSVSVSGEHDATTDTASNDQLDS